MACLGYEYHILYAYSADLFIIETGLYRYHIPFLKEVFAPFFYSGFLVDFEPHSMPYPMYKAFCIGKIFTLP